MASDLYCSRADVLKRLPMGSIPSPSSVLASSLAGTDVLTADGHGLETDDEVSVRAIEDGTLSAPFVAGTTYYAIRLSHSTFQLAATAGGAAIDITTDGVEMRVIREPSFDDDIEFYSRWADGIIPHLVPLESPIHPIVRGCVADLAAKRVLNGSGQDSATINAAELAAKAILERYGKGIPLRGAAITGPANLAVTATLTTSSDPRGWGSGTLP